MSSAVYRHPAIRIATSVILFSCAVVVMNGIHMMQEIRKVPVDRLAQNLERTLAKAPENNRVRLNLARLYAMAYALKVTEFDARSEGAALEPFFGFEVPHMPGPVQAARSRESQERARVYLTKAIKTYEAVVQRDPSDAIAHLGLGWSLEQSADKPRAIDSYRKAVETAWPKERAEKYFWQDPVTAEAAERLRVLLDPVKDARELASLEEKVDGLSLGRTITPIAIPLVAADGPPVAPSARVRFDADGSGFRREWTWITRDAGWLVYDHDGSGEITSALQWFGNVTFWLFWDNGYEALRALDDDGDGELTGEELARLAIWHDANQDGVSGPGEVRTLAAHRIVALSTRYSECDDPWMVARSDRGVTFADGSRRTSYDVILRQVPSGSQQTTKASFGR